VRPTHLLSESGFSGFDIADLRYFVSASPRTFNLCNLVQSLGVVPWGFFFLRIITRISVSIKKNNLLLLNWLLLKY
jgi:hypothetical protein